MRNEFKSSKHKWDRSEQKSFYFCYLCNKLTNGLFSDILECRKCGIIIHKICRFGFRYVGSLSYANLIASILLPRTMLPKYTTSGASRAI